MTLWKNDEAYVKNYLSDFDGYYTMGDEGMIDERGYVHVLGRSDDVINVAGHRLDTVRIEEAIGLHKQVLEVAVIGLKDNHKGEVPLALVVVRESDQTQQVIVDKLNRLVR